MENLKDMPGHHFSNRGGVLFEKDFVGFEKYYKNGDAMMDWYKKAYPAQFNSASKESSWIKSTYYREHILVLSVFKT